MNDDFSVLDPILCREIPRYAAYPISDRAALCEYGIIQAQRQQRGMLGTDGGASVIVIVGIIISIVATAVATTVGIVKAIVGAVQSGKIQREQTATARITDRAVTAESEVAAIEADTNVKTNTARAAVIGIGIIATVALYMAFKK